MLLENADEATEDAARIVELENELDELRGDIRTVLESRCPRCKLKVCAENDEWDE